MLSPRRYIVVNIPATFAEAVEGDKAVRRHRVIVGKTEKPSPTLTAEITGVVLNPTWTVPASIAKTEISAHMRKDPGYSRACICTFWMRTTIRSIRIRWIGPARGCRTLRCASRTASSTRSVRSNRHTEFLFGLHARYQPTQPSSTTTTASIPTAAGGSTMSAILPRGCFRRKCRNGIGRDRCCDRKRGAPGGRPAEEGAGCLDLPHGLDERDQTVQFRNDVYAEDEQLLQATAEEAAFFNQAINHPLTAHMAP